MGEHVGQRLHGHLRAEVAVGIASVVVDAEGAATRRLLALGNPAGSVTPEHHAIVARGIVAEDVGEDQLHVGAIGGTDIAAVGLGQTQGVGARTHEYAAGVGVVDEDDDARAIGQLGDACRNLGRVHLNDLGERVLGCHIDDDGVASHRSDNRLRVIGFVAADEQRRHENQAHATREKKAKQLFHAAKLAFFPESTY